MDDAADRIMTGDASERPYGGTCPACKREYRHAITFTGDGVIRGQLAGDVCITPRYLFAHSEITIDDPDGEFPTKEVGAMGNRKEVPVERTEVSSVWVSDAADGTSGAAFLDSDE